ncbi:MAG TPA: ribosome-associated translation inhibitor RaiA [Polyangiaceae bacterium]|jgi:putative sigma-54 modulation protein|nr:ribosome-associated translation inhibitor RaiA [Polyangiaceae bacterium]
MNISITFRQMDASDAIKKYATGKLAKLQRFLRRPMEGKVTVSVDRRKHVVEARISSGSEHLEAHEVTDDMYASIDQVMAKLERQIRGSKGTARARRHDGDSLKTIAEPLVAAAPAGAKPGPTARRPKKKTKAGGAKRTKTAR